MTHCVARLSLLAAFASASFACSADPNANAPSSIVFSEIMYHPVSEDAAEDNHEFIEISIPRNLDGRNRKNAFKEMTGKVNDYARLPRS